MTRNKCKEWRRSKYTRLECAGAKWYKTKHKNDYEFRRFFYNLFFTSRLLQQCISISIFNAKGWWVIKDFFMKEEVVECETSAKE